jgi:hypothetical protein
VAYLLAGIRLAAALKIIRVKQRECPVFGPAGLAFAIFKEYLLKDDSQI